MSEKTSILAAMILVVMSNVAAAADSPVVTVNRFQEALVAGDVAGAKDFLQPDVLIYESGGVEASRDEYEKEHLGADIAFLKNASIQTLEQKTKESADLAWVTTRTRMTGKFEDKAFDIYSNETMGLTRTKSGWRISHIHWSSKPVTPSK